MHPREIVTLFVLGCFLLIVGLTPGIVQGLVRGLNNFTASLLPYRRRTIYFDSGKRLPGQIGFAIAGAALLAISLSALLSH